WTRPGAYCSRGLERSLSVLRDQLPAHAASWPGSTTAVGRLGGVAKVAVLKSKNSSIGSAAASRLVSDGNPNRVSTNLRIDVWSCTTCDTELAFEYGETTTTG